MPKEPRDGQRPAVPRRAAQHRDAEPAQGVRPRRRATPSHEPAALPRRMRGGAPLLLRAAPASAFVPVKRRVRPSDPEWPSADAWEQLNQAVGGRLIKVQTPLEACRAQTDADACAALFKELKNPYYIRDQVGVTQTLGWIDGWTYAPSVYAVAARQYARRGRRHRLRPQAQPAPRRQRRRPQLPRHLQRAGFAADLDPLHGRHHAARRVRPARLQRTRRSRP